MSHPNIRLFKFTIVLIALGLIGVVATNSSVSVRVGLAFADDTRRIDYAYRLALGRPPTPAEVRKGLESLREIRPDLTAIRIEEEAQTRAALASYFRVLLSSSEFIFVV